jgi:hypothetical protein
MTDKARLILENSRLGLKTKFFNDKNGVLGYTENGVIFLNEFFDDIEKVNKHEVLHQFDSSETFKIIKESLFKLLTEKELDELKQKYYLRYCNLYSQEEINGGIIDDEIAIDMIVDNENFSDKIKEFSKGLYEIITKDKIFINDKKRYLNISLSTQTNQQFSHCSLWEKIFITNYYDGKENILPQRKETKYNQIKADILQELEGLYLYALDPRNFVIFWENNEELEREYQNEIKALIARGEGEGAQYLKEYKTDSLKMMAYKLGNTQREEYQHIVDIIKLSNYEPAFKYLMLNETLTKIYKQETDEKGNKTFVKKREQHISIAGHMTLNEVVLKTIYNNLKSYSSFANLYFAGLSLFNKSTAQTSGINIENINTFGKGKWLKFEGKKSNYKEYIKNAQTLSALVQNTPWCTKSLASSQLEQGDFFVFVDNDNQPHIAVKMNGDEIDEVRGIKNGEEQALEDDYRMVAKEFLIKNKEIKYGKEWLEKEEWNERLIAYSNAIDNFSLNTTQIDKMLYDLFSFLDYKAHLGENSNRTNLFRKIRSSEFAQNVIAKAYNCSK